MNKTPDTTLSKKPVASKSTSKQIDTILATPDGQKYLQMCEISNQVTKDQLYDNPVKATDFSSAYYRWIDAEKPGMSMPKMPQAETVAIPAVFTRLLHKNKEYLVVLNNNGTKEGVTYIPKRAKDTHPITGEPMQMDVIVGQTPTYFLEFDPAEAKARMDHADKLLEQGEQYKCYLFLNTRNYVMTPENFLKPWKDLVQDIAHNKPLHV